MNLTELKKLAEAANRTDVNWISASPQTILALLALIEKQHEQLSLTTTNLLKGMSKSIQKLQARENQEALAAYEEMK